MELIILDKVDSTNAYLKREYKNLSDRTCLMAINQYAGIGRRGHTWSSEGKNLTVSFLLKDETNIQDVWKYTLILAKAAVDLLDDYGIEASVKWPNDIYVHDQKIAGILVETIYEQKLEGIVAGIGLNVNNAYPYISMKDLLYKDIDVHDVLLKFVNLFEKELDVYNKGRFKDILAFINDHAYLRGKWVEYLDYGLVSFLGINHDGLVEFVDQNNQSYQTLINEITLTKPTK